MVKSVVMVMSLKKYYLGGRNLLKLVVWKRNRKKRTSNLTILLNLRKLKGKIHNPIKYQNWSHQQKQLTAMSR